MIILIYFVLLVMARFYLAPLISLFAIHSYLFISLLARRNISSCEAPYPAGDKDYERS